MDTFDDSSELHIFVCTNDRSAIVGNTKPCCASLVGESGVKVLKEWVRERGLGGRVVVTKTGCLGYCNEVGAVACVYPKGYFVRGLQSVDDVKKVILAEIKK